MNVLRKAALATGMAAGVVALGVARVVSSVLNTSGAQDRLHPRRDVGSGTDQGLYSTESPDPGSILENVKSMLQGIFLFV